MVLGILPLLFYIARATQFQEGICKKHLSSPLRLLIITCSQRHVRNINIEHVDVKELGTWGVVSKHGACLQIGGSLKICALYTCTIQITNYCGSLFLTHEPYIVHILISIMLLWNCPIWIVMYRFKMGCTVQAPNCVVKGPWKKPLFWTTASGTYLAEHFRKLF